MDTPSLQIIYVTGHNATGKTTLCEQLAEKHEGWHFIDGDEFRKGHPELEQSITDACKVIDLMRGTLGNESLVDEVTQNAAEIRAAWVPHFTGVFEKLRAEMLATGKHKVVFPYHCYHCSTLDLLRTVFPGGPGNCKVVEVEVERELLKERFFQREVKAGMDHEKAWREDQGARMKLCREHYGPEYNKEDYKKLLEWRFIFYREQIKEEPEAGVYVVNNDKFDAAEQLEKLFSA